jgi:hypothetical protein
MMAMATFNFDDLFTSREMKESKGKGGQFLNLIIGVQDVFGTL